MSPMIYRTIRGEDGSPEVEAFSTLADAKTGRWCMAPAVPDRCYKCFDPKTLQAYPAEGYREEHDGKITWRYGTCHRCTKEA